MFSQKETQMANLSDRTYTSQQDLDLMLKLIATVRPAKRIGDYPGPADLRELLALAEVRQNTRLWFDAAGSLKLFALVDHYCNLLFELDPALATPNLEQEIIDWGVACIRRMSAADDEVQSLDASCRAEDSWRLAFLERHGFLKQESCSVGMQRSLAEPIPAPQLPPGFSIRPVRGEEEVQALVALHRAAFDSTSMTDEERLAMMRGPDYERELDLVVVAPDGRLAAYCVCTISAEENQRSGRKDGYTDPVATHPDFQKLGLGKALLCAGMSLLKARGAETAVLGTSSENIAMQKTALAVGFQVTSTKIWFSKPVPRAEN
jgi:ribosomal protein S18 acetylase RimI-like enzyme